MKCLVSLLCKVYFPDVWFFFLPQPGIFTPVPDISTLRSKMATYYTLFASVQQLTQPVVSVPYVDAFGLGKEFSLTKKQLLFESNVGFNRCPQYRKSNRPK